MNLYTPHSSLSRFKSISFIIWIKHMKNPKVFLKMNLIKKKHEALKIYLNE